MPEWHPSTGMKAASLALFLLTCALPAVCQPGSISGIVVDASGASVAGALVKVPDGLAPATETRAAEDGRFSFASVNPGSYRLSFTADGFEAKTLTGDLRAGEALDLGRIVLSVAALTTDVNVTQTQAEIAQTQIRQAETQRLIGAVPNFFVSYDSDAVPLTTKQKFELTWKTFLDPSAFAITGIIAGVQQAENSHKGFGQGGRGYAKRYGASYADFVTQTLLERVALPAVFRQDPRYFYKGTGSVGSRFRYAVSRSVICRGDNGKEQFCYSRLISQFGGGALTNLYYPASDRDSAGTVVQNAAIGIGAEALANLFQEFAAKKITRRKH